MNVLKTARAAAGLTQAEVATKAGVATATVVNVETGRKPLTGDVAALVAPVMGVDPVRLLLSSVREDALATVKSATEGRESVGVAGLDAVRRAVVGLSRFSDDEDVPVAVRQMAKSMVADVLNAVEVAATQQAATGGVRRDLLGRAMPAPKGAVRRDLYGRARRGPYGEVKRE